MATTPAAMAPETWCMEALLWVGEAVAAEAASVAPTVLVWT